MTLIYAYAFGGVFLTSLVSLVGILAMSIKEELLRKYIFVFISLAVGALLGDAFIHLIPEAIDGPLGSTTASLLTISGILIFFTLEKFLHWHHHGEDTEENDIHPAGKMVLLSDGLHNFIDGIIIGGSFLTSPALGLATTLAVILHEIPQEIGDFGVLIHSGYTKMRALFLNFLSAISAFLGLILVFLFGEISETFVLFVLPIAAGGFIYVAVADLIPELHKTKENRHSIIQIIAVVVGVFSMIALLLLE